MKKVLSLMLCMLLLLCMTVTAYATETTNSSTIVSVTVPPESYTLNIPATATISSENKTGELTVSLTDVQLIWSDRIYVYFDAANAIEGEYGSVLKHTENDNQIPYTIYDNYGSMYKKGSTSCNHAVESDGGPSNGTIGLEIDSSYQYPGAGTYTDTLTFYVTFTSIPDQT